MRLSRLLFGLVSLGSVASVGCAAPPDGEPQASTADAEGVADATHFIINGTFDGGNDAVCAIATEQGGYLSPFCTATIVGVNGSTGYALSAAHCTPGAGEQVPSPDYLICIDSFSDSCPGPNCRLFPITDMTFNPAYDGGPGADISMLTFSEANASTPIIPITDLDDGLAEGTAIEVSGYGLVDNANGSLGETSERRHAFTKIQDTALDGDNAALYLDAFEAPQSYSGPNGGTCSGDSGGPVITGTGAAARVVGTTSQGDQDCAIGGYYCRISYSVNHDFIVSYMGGDPNPCNTCTETALSGACATSYNTCLANPECSALLTCVNACASQACVDQCGVNHPNGVADYDGTFECAVCTQCATTCPTDGCGADPTTTTGAGVTTGAGGAGAGGGSSDGTGGDASDGSDDEGSGNDSAEDAGGCSVGGSAGAPTGGLAAWAGLWVLGAAALRRRARRG